MLSIDCPHDISLDLDKIIQTVAVMDEGQEFEFSEDELILFANHLENE